LAHYSPPSTSTSTSTSTSSFIFDSALPLPPLQPSSPPDFPKLFHPLYSIPTTFIIIYSIVYATVFIVVIFPTVGSVIVIYATIFIAVIFLLIIIIYSIIYTIVVIVYTTVVIFPTVGSVIDIYATIFIAVIFLLIIIIYSIVYTTVVIVYTTVVIVVIFPTVGFAFIFNIADIVIINAIAGPSLTSSYIFLRGRGRCPSNQAAGGPVSVPVALTPERTAFLPLQAGARLTFSGTVQVPLNVSVHG
jgi:hypothetical protein